MNKFTTTVKFEPLDYKIDHHSNILLMGSCFSEYIGSKLRNAGFSVEMNPFGVLFNPVSVKMGLEYLIENRRFIQKDLFFNGLLWGSFAHSTLFSATDPDVCLEKINTNIDIGHVHLLKTDFLLLTFGTAWVYDLKETGGLVANCHKLPAAKFNRRRLMVQEIVAAYATLFQNIGVINPKMQVVCTVSPVRHWKDGPHENTISKGILHLAIDELCKKFEFVHYFPAYEIQLDELRDYRFYAEDMIHPSPVAIHHIWQRFQTFCMHEETMKIAERIEEIRLQEGHRGIHPDSSEHQAFLKKLADKKQKFRTEYPYIDL
jgi:hypothetical protein